MKNILKMVDMGSKKTAAFVYAVYCNDKEGIIGKKLLIRGRFLRSCYEYEL